MPSLGLCKALLLATAYLLRASVVSTETTVTCEGGDNVHRLSCGANSVISIQGALYGRQDRETCSIGRPQSQLLNTECSQEGTMELLKGRCEGRTECELDMAVVSSSDPCRGTYKYLETKYTCLPAHYVVACEHSEARLFCDVGQVIDVYGAYYGRTDTTTCAYKRPRTQIQNVECPNSAPSVAASCEGKNSCEVRVSNSVFGDPCPGTYKYLEASYTCIYPDLTPNTA
ncbi:L-rhamnose-binding lectin SML-like [Pholidichthys leucotaenia]